MNNTQQPIEIPSDYYGVLIETDVDLIKLRYLVELIGEAKIRRSAERYTEKWPDTKPYISKLLKDYRVKVPVSLYRKVPTPVYCVYVLIIAGQDALKIGMSQYPLRRAASMPNISAIRNAGGVLGYYEADGSFFLQIGHCREDALKIEQKMLLFTAHYSIDKAVGISFGAGGSHEWRSLRALPRISYFLEDLYQGNACTTLRDGVEKYHETLSEQDYIPLNRLIYLYEQNLL